MKIKYKLSIMIIAIMVAVVAGISFVLLNQSSGITLDLSKTGIKYLADGQAQYWQGREDGHLRMLHTLAQVMGDYERFDPPDRRDRFDAMMMSVLDGESSLVTVYTVWKPNALDGMDERFIGREGSGPSGQYARVWAREGSGGEIIGRASADIALAMDFMSGPDAAKDRVDDPFLKNVRGKNTFLFRMTVPIISSRTKEVVGCVGCLLDTSVIQGVMRNVIASHGDEIAIMAIYSNSGFILAHFLTDRIGKMLTDVDVEYGADQQRALEAVRTGTAFGTSVFDPSFNANIELVMAPFPIGNSGQSWTVMIGAVDDHILAPVRRLRRFTIIIAAIAIAATAAIIFAVLNSSTKPIVKVTENLKDIAEGEGDLTQIINIHSKDEVGDLAHYFNETLAKIKSLVVIIKQQSLALSDVGSDLASNMTETAAAINEITANIQSIQGRILNQSASVTETHATMEQITLNINKLNEEVETQSASVAQSSSAIEEMLANIQSVTQTLIKNSENVRALSEASDVGRKGLEDVARDAQEIARESEGLLEINAVMENIASQTNLLSMNAAIEAAHAGEAGKGFAVVADEIRKLAENSGGQSKTISVVLKKIKGAIDKITLSTEQVLKKFEVIDSDITHVAEQGENIRSAMEEQGQGSKQILDAIGQVNEVTQQVKGGAEEMLEGSREVIRESKNLESATQEITGGMNEMAAGAEQINVAVSRVNELTGKNREYIDLLVREVSKFKVE